MKASRINTYFNLNFVKILKNILWISTFGLMALILIQFIFLFLQANQAKVNLRGVKSLLSKESNILNPYNLSSDLSDLEALDLIKCAVLQKEGDLQVFYDGTFKGNCDSSTQWKLGSLKVETSLRSMNGEVWHIEFISINSGFFYLALWISRFLALSTIFIFVLAKNWSVKKAIEVEEIKYQYSMQFVGAARQVAHDIRSPLSALTTVVQLMENVDEEKKALLKNVALRISAIANDLLDRTRLDYSSSLDKSWNESEMPTGFLVELINQVINEKKAEFVNTQIEISAETKLDSESGVVATEKVKLHRILSNVINNAVESCEGRSDSFVRIAIRDYREKIAIIISDNGIGIDEDILKNIFVAQKTISNKKHGNGIALKDAKTSIESWKGRLDISSKVGQGTMVSLILNKSV